MVPGTGCSVVGLVLREQLGGKDIGNKHDDLPTLIRNTHFTEENRKDYLIFSNIRNPFDRWVTHSQRWNLVYK